VFSTSFRLDQLHHLIRCDVSKDVFPLADLKAMDFDDFAAAVTATSKAFFNLP
jgi:hypothetical protein